MAHVFFPYQPTKQAHPRTHNYARTHPVEAVGVCVGPVAAVASVVQQAPGSASKTADRRRSIVSAGTAAAHDGTGLDRAVLVTLGM